MLQSVDREGRLTTTLIRYRVVRDDQVVEQKVQTMRMRLYFRDEIDAMLENAGFRQIREAGIDADAGAGRVSWMAVLTARK